MIAIVIAAILSLPLIHFAILSLKSSDDRVNQGNASNGDYAPPVQLAQLENRSINESSGIAASRNNSNVFWTHNDSGDEPFIYAFDRQGRDLGTWRVAGAQAHDWEDIAIGPGPAPGRSYLYIADIGDNGGRRDQITVYRVAEPSVVSRDSSSMTGKRYETDQAHSIQLKYPDGKHDAEAVLVHPATAEIYIVTKTRRAAARVYKLNAPLSESPVATLVYIAEVRLPNPFVGLITGGDISPDGRRVILCDYVGAYELVGAEGEGVAFDAIWKQTPVPVNAGRRRQGEAICYRTDGLALLATSERAPCPLIEIPRRTQGR
jgi:hypothetical protein